MALKKRGTQSAPPPDDVEEVEEVEEGEPATAADEAAEAEEATEAADTSVDPLIAYFGDVATPPEPLQRPAPADSVSLDTRKLDSKKLSKKVKATLAEWKTANRGKMLDSFLDRQLTAGHKKFGHRAVVAGDDVQNLVLGIPCPAFAFEWVTGQDCFLLGLVTQLVALFGVGKSALVSEFARWFDLAGGFTNLVENETKHNPHWYHSIMGRDRYKKRVRLHRATSVEGWQQHLTWSIQETQRDMIGTAKEPGPGPIFPVLNAVDSIMGKMSMESQEKILGAEGKNGKPGTTGTGYAPSRAFAVEAGSITKYMRTIPHLLDEWPFSLVLVNHLRIKKTDDGYSERNKTGGEQINFQESFELELAKVGGHKNKISCETFEGIPLKLSCEKNSFGPTLRWAETRLLWWHEKDDETGKSVQKSVWDWDWATVNLLDRILNGSIKDDTYYRSRLRDIDFHLKATARGHADNAAWCKSVGVKENDALSWGEIGALIREDQGLMLKLRDALGITHRPLLAGNYLAQKEELAEELP